MAACLTLAWVVGLGDSRHHRTSADLVSSNHPWRGAPRAHWEVGPPIRLRTTPDRPIAYCFQTIGLASARTYQVRAQFTTRQIEGRPGGRLVLLPLDTDGRLMYGEQHVVARHQGSVPWGTLGGLIQMPAAVQRADVGVELHGTSGELRAHSIEVYAVSERASSRWAYWLLVVLWVIALGREVPVMIPRVRCNVSHIVSVTTLCVILVGVLVPKSAPAAVVSWIRGGAVAVESVEGRAPPPTSKPATTRQARIAIDHEARREAKLLHKAAHFLLFLILAMALRSTGAHPTRRLLWMLVTLTAATELLQMFTATRTPRLLDFAIDLAGAILGMVCTTRLVRWRCVRAPTA